MISPGVCKNIFLQMTYYQVFLINSTQCAFKAVSPNQFQKNNAYLLFFILGSVNIERQKHILLGIS